LIVHSILEPGHRVLAAPSTARSLDFGLLGYELRLASALPYCLAITRTLAGFALTDAEDDTFIAEIRVPEGVVDSPAMDLPGLNWVSRPRLPLA